MPKKREEREIERWITVRGARVPIFKGQSVEEAIKESVGKRGADKKQADKKEVSSKEERRSKLEALAKKRGIKNIDQMSDDELNSAIKKSIDKAAGDYMTNKKQPDKKKISEARKESAAAKSNKAAEAQEMMDKYPSSEKYGDDHITTHPNGITPDFHGGESYKYSVPGGGKGPTKYFKTKEEAQKYIDSKSTAKTDGGENARIGVYKKQLQDVQDDIKQFENTPKSLRSKDYDKKLGELKKKESDLKSWINNDIDARRNEDIKEKQIAANKKEAAQAAGKSSSANERYQQLKEEADKAYNAGDYKKFNELYKQVKKMQASGDVSEEIITGKSTAQLQRYKEKAQAKIDRANAQHDAMEGKKVTNEGGKISYTGFTPAQTKQLEKMDKQLDSLGKKIRTTQSREETSRLEKQRDNLVQKRGAYLQNAKQGETAQASSKRGSTPEFKDYNEAKEYYQKRFSEMSPQNMNRIARNMQIGGRGKEKIAALAEAKAKEWQGKNGTGEQKYTVTGAGKKMKSFNNPKDADDYVSKQVKAGNGVASDYNVRAAAKNLSVKERVDRNMKNAKARHKRYNDSMKAYQQELDNAKTKEAKAATEAKIMQLQNRYFGKLGDKKPWSDEQIAEQKRIASKSGISKESAGAMSNVYDGGKKTAARSTNDDNKRIGSYTMKELKMSDDAYAEHVKQRLVKNGWSENIAAAEAKESVKNRWEDISHFRKQGLIGTFKESASSNGNAVSKKSIPTSQVQVSESGFQFAHGRKPRGKGNWAFTMGGEEVFFSGTYAEAKKKAIKEAARRGISKISTGS